MCLVLIMLDRWFGHVNFYSRFQYGYLKTTIDTAVILTGGRLFIFKDFVQPPILFALIMPSLLILMKK